MISRSEIQKEFANVELDDNNYRRLCEMLNLPQIWKNRAKERADELRDLRYWKTVWLISK